MKYLLSDYCLLVSISPKGSDRLGKAYENMCRYMVQPVTTSCLLHALRGLSAGGYIAVEPENGVFTVSTPISLTESGRKAAVLSGLQKLLGEEKFFLKKERAFCAVERPEVHSGEAWTVEAEGFDRIARELLRGYEITLPMFEITDLGDGVMKLTVHHPSDRPDWDGDEDEDCAGDPDAAALCYSASVSGPSERIVQGLRDLIATAHALATEPPRTRKVALHGSDRSLLMSLANAANEQGLVTFRVTVSQIRFNRQRFIGKRDSDLDYAQCGDPIFIHEMSSGEGFAYFEVLHAALSHPELLSEADFHTLSDIHRFTH